MKTFLWSKDNRSTTPPRWDKTVATRERPDDPKSNVAARENPLTLTPFASRRAEVSPRSRGEGTGGKRFGFSLIELIVVITMMGGILTLTGTTFHLLMRSEKSATLSFVTERSIASLAVKFRDDVHQSESGNIIVNATTKKNELALGDTEGVHIRYAITGEGLARLVMEGDQIAARDDFRLPECHIDLKAGEESRLRILVIERPGATLTRNAGAARPLRTLQIQAYLNRFRPTVVAASSTKPLDRPESRSDTTEEPK